MNDEQFIFRFADPSLAERVRRALREVEPLNSPMDLSFPGRSLALFVTGMWTGIVAWDPFEVDAECRHACRMDDYARHLANGNAIILCMELDFHPSITLSIGDAAVSSDAEPGRRGQLLFEGRTYRVDLLDLPTVVESYKTLDDANLLKTGDIGQVLLVGGEITPGQIECRDGVTPPMRNARERHFKQLPKLDNKVGHLNHGKWHILIS